jgi:hypothetical protein
VIEVCRFTDTYMSDAFGTGSLRSEEVMGSGNGSGKGMGLMVRLRWARAVQKHTRLPRPSIAAVGGVKV